MIIQKGVVVVAYVNFTRAPQWGIIVLAKKYST